jgi:WD40 repeat protein
LETCVDESYLGVSMLYQAYYKVLFIFVLLGLILLVGGTSLTQDEENVSVYITSEYLILYVTPGNTPISLRGLQLVTTLLPNGEGRYTVTELFPSLQSTNSYAVRGTCYVLKRREQISLPTYCTNTNLRSQVQSYNPPFWVDTGSTEAVFTIAIHRDNQTYFPQGSSSPVVCVPDQVCEFYFEPSPDLGATQNAIQTSDAINQTAAAAATQTAEANALATINAASTQNAVNAQGTAIINIEQTNAVNAANATALSFQSTIQANETSVALTAIAPTPQPTIPPTSVPIEDIQPTPISRSVTIPPVSTRILRVQRPVNNLAWDNSGRYLAAALRNGTVCLWDIQSGSDEPVCVPDAHVTEAYSVNWSPRQNRALLATTGADNQVRIWEVTAEGLSLIHEQSEYSIQDAPLHFTDAEWSYDGNYLAGIDNQQRLFIWDTNTWERQGNPIPIQLSEDLDWSDDSRYLISISVEGAIQIIDRSANTVVDLLGSYQEGGKAVDWRSTGVATIGLDGALRYYDYSPGNACPSAGCEYTRIAQNYAALNDVRFSPDGSFIAMATRGNVRIYEAVSPYRLINVYRPNQPESNLTALAWNPLGSQIAGAVDEESAVYIWPVSTELPNRLTELGSLSQPQVTGQFGDMSWNRDGSRLGVINNRLLVIWDIAAFSIAGYIEHEFVPTSLSWNPRSDTIAVGLCNSKTEAIVWNISDLNNIQESRRVDDDIDSCITDISFNPNPSGVQTQLATGDLLGNMHHWDWDNVLRLGTDTMPQQINQLAWANNGLSLGLVSETGEVRVLDMSRTRATPVFSRQPTVESMLSLAWSPTGNLLATGNEAGWIQVWDIVNTESNSVGYAGGYRLEAHTTEVVSLSWYNDASHNWLISLSRSSSASVLTIWEALSGERLVYQTMPLSTQVIWSPASLTFALAQDNGTISLWSFNPQN